LNSLTEARKLIQWAQAETDATARMDLIRLARHQIHEARTDLKNQRDALTSEWISKRTRSHVERWLQRISDEIEAEAAQLAELLKVT
jgi:hypothetical protein